MTAARPRDGSSATVRAWLAVISIAIGTFAMVTTEFLPIGLLTAIANGFGASEGMAGLMVTLPGIVAAIATPVRTIAVGAIDRRILVVMLTALIVFSNTVAFFARSFAVMLVGPVLLGLCVGGFWTFSAAIGRRLVPEEAGGRATALIIAAISVVTVAGVPAGSLIGEWAGWRAAFATTAVLSVLIGQAILLPRLPAKQAVRVRDIVALFEVPRARIGLLATAFISTGHFTAYTYLEPFQKQVVNLGPFALSGVLAAYGLAGLFGTFVDERVLGWNLRSGFAGIVLLLAASLFLAVLFGSSDAAAIAFCRDMGFRLRGRALGRAALALSGRSCPFRGWLGNDGDSVSGRACTRCTLRWPSCRPQRAQQCVHRGRAAGDLGGNHPFVCRETTIFERSKPCVR